MKPILARCGYRCDLCLAYKVNVEGMPSNQEKLSDGWHTYYGFRLAPEQIICSGCLSESAQLIDQGCPVRPCVIEKGLENCSQCDLYVCEKLEERIVVCEHVRDRIKGEIPEDDYVCFIRPYENKKRLDSLRGADDD